MFGFKVYQFEGVQRRRNRDILPCSPNSNLSPESECLWFSKILSGHIMGSEWVRIFAVSFLMTMTFVVGTTAMELNLLLLTVDNGGEKVLLLHRFDAIEWVDLSSYKKRCLSLDDGWFILFIIGGFFPAVSGGFIPVVCDVLFLLDLIPSGSCLVVLGFVQILTALLWKKPPWKPPWSKRGSGDEDTSFTGLLIMQWTATLDHESINWKQGPWAFIKWIVSLDRWRKSPDDYFWNHIQDTLCLVLTQPTISCDSLFGCSQCLLFWRCHLIVDLGINIWKSWDCLLYLEDNNILFLMTWSDDDDVLSFSRLENSVSMKGEMVTRRQRCVRCFKSHASEPYQTTYQILRLIRVMRKAFRSFIYKMLAFYKCMKRGLNRFILLPVRLPFRKQGHFHFFIEIVFNFLYLSQWLYLNGFMYHLNSYDLI